MCYQIGTTTIDKLFFSVFQREASLDLSWRLYIAARWRDFLHKFSNARWWTSALHWVCFVQVLHLFGRVTLLFFFTGCLTVSLSYFGFLIVMRSIYLAWYTSKFVKMEIHPGHVTRSNDWGCPMVLFILIFQLNSELSGGNAFVKSGNLPHEIKN